MAERTVDMVIAGGKIVSPESTVEALIAVDGGVIVAVGAAPTMPDARETVDAAGMHVLPGIIDSHVHFREPGYEYKEDWRSGTAAAACGGVTSVFEMPNTHPPTGTVEELARKQEIAANGAHVDYGIYGLLDENNLDQLEPMAAAGAAGFKCFMGNTFGNLPAPSDGAMLEARTRSPISPPARRCAPWRPSAGRPYSPNGPARACTSRTKARATGFISCATPRRAAST